MKAFAVGVILILVALLLGKLTLDALEPAPTPTPRAVTTTEVRPTELRYSGLDLSTAYARPALGIDAAVAEWRSQPRRMGCVTAARWFCNRVAGFYPVALTRTAPDGTRYQHTVAFNGVVVIDLQPLNDAPAAGRWIDQWASAPPENLPVEYYGPKVTR